MPPSPSSTKGTSTPWPVLPVSKNDELEDIVKALLKRAKSLARIDTVLLDRGFYITNVLKTIAEMGMDYVIPLRKGVGSDRILAGV